MLRDHPGTFTPRIDAFSRQAVGQDTRQGYILARIGAARQCLELSQILRATNEDPIMSTAKGLEVSVMITQAENLSRALTWFWKRLGYFEYQGTRRRFCGEHPERRVCT